MRTAAEFQTAARNDGAGADQSAADARATFFEHPDNISRGVLHALLAIRLELAAARMERMVKRAEREERERAKRADQLKLNVRHTLGGHVCISIYDPREDESELTVWLAPEDAAAFNRTVWATVLDAQETRRRTGKDEA